MGGSGWRESDGGGIDVMCSHKPLVEVEVHGQCLYKVRLEVGQVSNSLCSLRDAQGTNQQEDGGDLHSCSLRVDEK